ncbi:MAG: hypothetical protein MI922_29180, partial [Bacteroidales bacterium]|nr:hypothetical protein [Bacteroidales bacterium]
MKKVYYFIATLVLAVNLQNAFSQDLSNIGKAPLLSTSGGIGVNQVFFNTSDSLSYRKPYSYTVTANLNLAIYGWSIPLSMVYSNQNWSYQQPFNQFTLHPSYKWVRTHIGYSSMTFSPYSLSGHQFLGGGVELTPPQNFKVSAMFGRLQKRILPDTNNAFDPEYQRYGGGAAFEYMFKGGMAGFDVFYAKDDLGSFNNAILDSFDVLPQENLVLGVKANYTIASIVTLGANYALSTHTSNVLAGETKIEKGNLPWFNYRESTQEYHAFKSNANVNLPYFVIGAGYERIDPDYKTLGSYYNRNDLENITGNFSTALWQNKISFACSYGFERDNLNDLKEQENVRNISSLNLGFAPIDKL